MPVTTINSLEIRKPWRIVSGFVSATFLLLKDGISVVGEINRRPIQARIPLKLDLPFGLEVESAGFSSLLNNYDGFDYDSERNLFVTPDGEFAIVVKQDSEGILAEMAEMDLGEESSKIDLSVILPSINTMNPVLLSSPRPVLFAKGNTLACTDGRRASFSYIPELESWAGDEVKALPGEIMMLAKRAESCLLSSTEEAIIVELDGCRIYQERVAKNECGIGNTIVNSKWVSDFETGTFNVEVDSTVLLDVVKFVKDFTDRFSKVFPRVVLDFNNDGITVSSGKGKKTVTVFNMGGSEGTKIEANLDYFIETLSHVAPGKATLGVSPKDASPIVMTNEGSSKKAVLMTLKLSSGV